MKEGRRVRLFRDGRNQAVRIPREFELPGKEATLRRDGDRLIVEPIVKRGLLAVLSRLRPIPDRWPDVDRGLLPADDVDL